jgi:hypothetical protein
MCVKQTAEKSCRTDSGKDRKNRRDTSLSIAGSYLHSYNFARWLPDLRFVIKMSGESKTITRALRLSMKKNAFYVWSRTSAGSKALINTS